MHQINKTVLAVIFLSSVFITNASEEITAESTSEILKRIATEVDPNQAQKKLRMFFKGDEGKCVEAFQRAIKEENTVAQLHLANTYFAMSWHQDSQKDFTRVKKEQLKSYLFSPRAINLLEQMYKKVNPSLSWWEHEEIAHQTVYQAAKIGNSYAQLIQILEGRLNKNTNRFGIACKLKSLINQKQQFPELLYTFGSSLFNTYRFNPQLGLAGLKYIEQSGFFNLEFFEDTKMNYPKNTSFEEYCEKRFRTTYLFYRHGICFHKNHILASSHEHWKKFKKEILDPLQPLPDSLFDLFEKHDMNTIAELVEKHNLHFISLPDNSLQIYAMNESGEGEKRGTITLSEDESKKPVINLIFLYHQDALKKINIILNFLQDALFRCRDSYAVTNIIDDLRYGKTRS